MVSIKKDIIVILIKAVISILTVLSDVFNKSVEEVK